MRPLRFDVPTTLVLLSLACLTAGPAHAAGPGMSECLSANESAIRLRSDRKLVGARDQSLVCAAQSCPAELRDACQGRVKELTAAIPSIVFEVKDAGGKDVTAVSVTMDGELLVDHLDGTAVAVNPGEHAFVFAVPGHAGVTKRVVIYQGEKNRRERVELGGGPAAPQPASTSSGMGTQKLVGLTLGGAGVVGVGVGAVFGATALSAWSSVTSACGAGGASRCAPSNRSSVQSDQSSAQTDATVSTAALIAGGALVAAGAVLFLTGGQREHEPSSAPSVAVAPTFGPGQGGLSLTGAF